MTTRPICFVDRDGTIIAEPDDLQVDSLAKLRLVDGVIPALLRIQDAGYDLVMVSNQDGLGTESFPQEHFDAPHGLMMQILTSQGVRFREAGPLPLHLGKRMLTSPREFLWPPKDVVEDAEESAADEGSHSVPVASPSKGPVGAVAD